MALRRTLGSLLLPLLLGGCAITPLEHGRWIEVRSPNFTILTDLDRDHAVRLSEQLELFRAVVAKLTNAWNFAPRVPTRIFVFGSLADLRAFTTDRWPIGFFHPGLRENLVVLEASGLMAIGASTTLFHEYTHFLTHNQDHPPLPRWYEEGFAEFMGMLKIQEERVLIGAAPGYRTRPGLGIDLVLRARSLEGWNPDQIAMFYLESWQIVHYLTLGPGKTRGKLGERMLRYILAVERGEDEERAFQAAFGMTFRQLHNQVASYHRSRRIPAVAVARSAFSPDRGAEVREVAAGEVGVRLGMLALELDRVELAGDTFERVLASDPASARAHAGLGNVYSRTGRSDRAEAHYARSLELRPDDYENHLDRAKSLHRAAEEQGQLELLPRAREHCARAIELAPGIPEGHLLLGATYLLTKEDPSPGLRAAERARELLPGHPEVQLVLARLYRHAGQRPSAIASARRVALWSHGEMHQQAQALLAELGDGPASPDPP